MFHARPKLATLVLLGAGVAVLALVRPPGRRQAGRDANRPRHRVVIVGAGFGGLNAALRLAGRREVDLTLIDAHNHHLFQPMLYQVATAALSPADIASSIRGIIPASAHARVLMATVSGVDTAARHVLCDGEAVPYDELIIATGSRPSYFGHDAWSAAAPGLKTLGDALAMRGQILASFERAAETHDHAERGRLLTFVLIGGGPTGVEMAGSIAELARDTLARDYDIRDMPARIVLVEAGARILPAFPPDLSASAFAALRELGVEVRAGTRVTQLEPGMVHLHDGMVPAATVIWTAGTEATPVADWLGVKPGHGGRVEVGAELGVPGRPGVFVIGDAALAQGKDGKPLPGLAPVAKQQGQYVGRGILRRLRGRGQRPFTYRDYGTLATIGRNKAVAEFGPIHLTGFPAWLLWAAAHIFFLIGFRNRVMVGAQWAFAYITRERPGRLLIGSADQPPVAKPG